MPVNLSGSNISTFSNGARSAPTDKNQQFPGYQQGIWTASFANASIPQTETTFQPDWYRIGQWVTVNARVQWTGLNTSETIRVVGLPYPNVVDFTTGSNYVGACMTQNQSGGITGVNGPANNIVAYAIDPGITFYWGSGSDGFQNVLFNNFSTTDSDNQIIFSVTYKTDDTDWQPLNGATIS